MARCRRCHCSRSPSRCSFDYSTGEAPCAPNSTTRNELPHPLERCARALHRVATDDAPVRCRPTHDGVDDHEVRHDDRILRNLQQAVEGRTPPTLDDVVELQPAPLRQRFQPFATLGECHSERRDLRHPLARQSPAAAIRLQTHSLFRALPQRAHDDGQRLCPQMLAQPRAPAAALHHPDPDPAVYSIRPRPGRAGSDKWLSLCMLPQRRARPPPLTSFR